MFECVVEDCDKKFRNETDRNRHLAQKHSFPKYYCFGKKKKACMRGKILNQRCIKEGDSIAKNCPVDVIKHSDDVSEMEIENITAELKHIQTKNDSNSEKVKTNKKNTKQSRDCSFSFGRRKSVGIVFPTR